MKFELLCHSDEVSGTCLFEDGVKVYYGEGPCAGAVVVHPDGRRVDAMLGYNQPCDEWWWPYVDAAQSDDIDYESRMMSAEEETEWEEIWEKEEA